MGLPDSVFVHPNALVDSNDIGERTRIWAFVHIFEDAHIGSDCNVCDYVNVESDAYVGDRVTLKQRAIIGMGSHVEDDAFIGPGVILANDNAPRSARMAGAPDIQNWFSNTDNWLKHTRVCRGASIASSVVLCPGVTVGEFAMVGAGAIVTKDVEPFRRVHGSPARPVGWVCVCAQELVPDDSNSWQCSKCSRKYRHTPSSGLALI